MESKINKTTFLFLLIVFTACFQNNCTTDRLLGRNDGIGRLDTIVIIPTITNLVPIANETEIVNDTLLPHKISDSIVSIAARLLGNKYATMKMAGKNKLNLAQTAAFIGAINAFEADEINPELIKLEKSIYDQFNPLKKRHILITYMEGKYKTKEKIKSGTNAALAASAALTAAIFATTGMVSFLMPRYSTSVMKTILYDTKKECIVYYHASRISHDDLWDNLTIKNFVYAGCKKLYYRKNK